MEIRNTEEKDKKLRTRVEEGVGEKKSSNRRKDGRERREREH